jgi:hypothetical protein
MMTKEEKVDEYEVWLMSCFQGSQTLQKGFKRTAFPSTILREDVALQLGISPRTAHIWFQNKRQAVRRAYK